MRIGKQMASTAVEQDTAHRLRAAIGRVARRLNAKAASFDRLVVAADATSLGVFRTAASTALTAKLTAEIDRDYVHTPLPELEAALAKRMGEG